MLGWQRLQKSFVFFFLFYFSCATTRIERVSPYSGNVFLSYYHLFRLLACTTRRAGVFLFGFAPGFSSRARDVLCTDWLAIFGLLPFHTPPPPSYPFLLCLHLIFVKLSPSPFYSDFSMILPAFRNVFFQAFGVQFFARSSNVRNPL